MNILYDHQIFMEQKYGGISRYFYELITRIALKESVSLFEGVANNMYGIKGYKNLKHYDKIDSPIVKSKSLMRKIIKLRLLWFTLKSKPSIYHPTYYENYCVPKVKKIVTVYDMINEIFARDFGKKDWVLEKKRKMVESADGIIAISESTKNDIIKLYGTNPQKIKVIYLANSLKTEAKGERIVQKPYILYVGSRWGYKNFTNTLRAFSTSKYKNDICLVCFGGGDITVEEGELIKKLGLENSIIQKTGDDAVLSNLYKNAEIFIYPSKYEGFGIPPLEAMYYGTPVLVSRCSSIPEVVGEAALYFNPESVDDMAEKIDMLLGNTSLQNNLINKGYEREEMFSWDSTAIEHINYYRRFL